MVDIGLLATVEVGQDKRIINVQIKGEYDMTLFLLKQGSRKLGLCRGMFCRLGGPMGTPMGPGG